MNSAPRPGGRVFTFYSYKGGTGRSLAMANIAWILACNGKRVLMIDWDLEAPGLHRYFRPFLIDDELSSSEGLLDLVDRYASRVVAPTEAGAQSPSQDWYLEYADYTDYLLSINFRNFPHGGRLDLLPAGRQGESYAVKVNSFNWQNLYDRLAGGGFFEAVKARAVREYDYVLIDSRTGVSDTAGICSVQMPDTLVVCFTYNNQSIMGASSVARSARGLRQQLQLDETKRRTASAGGSFEDSPYPYRVFAVPMRVDTSESDRLALRQAFARNLFAEFLAQSGISNPQEYWGRVEVPYVSFYAYEEVLSAFKDDWRDPKTVLSAFVRLAEYLTDGHVSQYNLPIAPEERQALLERFAETPLTAAGRAALVDSQRETDEQAIVRRADAALGELSPPDRAVALRIFGRLVRVAPKAEGGGILPIRASLDDFDEDEHRVIAHFAERQVLRVMTEAQGDGPLTPAGRSVSFEDPRLVGLWSSLSTQIEGDREFLLWRQQLRNRMEYWQLSGRDAGSLLPDRFLAEARVRLRGRGRDLNAAEREYVERSSGFVPADERGGRASRSGRPSANRRPSTAILFGLAAMIAVLLVAGLLVWRMRPASPARGSAARADVIMAAASATRDPLERALLLLELGPTGSERPAAVDLALQSATRPLPYAILRGPDRPATTIRFTGDGTGLVAGFDNGSVWTWLPGSFASPAIVNTQAGGVVSAVVDAKAEHVLVTGRNNVAEYWALAGPARTASRALVANLLEGTITDGLPVAAYRDSSGMTSRLSLYIAQTSPQEAKPFVKRLTNIPESTTNLVFGGDGRLAVAAWSQQVMGWELPSGRVLLNATLPPRTDLCALLVAPTGGYAAAATNDDVLVWSVGAAKNVPVRFAYSAGVAQRTPDSSVTAGATSTAFALSSDGRMVAVSYSDGSVRLLRADGESVALSDASPAITRAMAFSPDGRLVAASGGDGTTRIWRTPAFGPQLITADWSTLSEELRAMTTACLAKDDRVRLLGESTADATAASAECEKKFGLKSLIDSTTK